MAGKKRDLIVSQVFREHSLFPGYYTQKYSEKMDNERKKLQERSQLPGKKRRQLELKQERITQKGANEAAEGDTYQSEVGLSDQVDIQTNPEAVPKPGFAKVDHLNDVQENRVVIDLETTGLIQRGLMPHITQIAAQDMSTNAKFSCYVSPKVPINEKAEQTTGISWDGERMTVHGTQVATVSISEALSKFFNFLKNIGNVILIAHNGRVFDFRILSYTICRLGKMNEFLNYVLAFVDTLSLFRSKVPKLASYKQEFLAKHFCLESYNAHDAVDDVNMLEKILCASGTEKLDYVKHSYASNCHFIQEKFNLAKTQNIDSLHCLVASGVLKLATAENIAGSGLNLQHLKLVWQRDGEDGLRNIFTAKNCIEKPRVTKDQRLLANIIPKLCLFFEK